MKWSIERSIQFSGILVIVGLLIELISLNWAHPTAFLFFAIAGGFFLFVGIVFYLYSLIGGRPQGATENPGNEGKGLSEQR